MSKLLKIFGNQVARYRKLRGYSQEQLAEKLDAATSTISDWENGKAFIKYSSLKKLCEALEINETDLFIYNYQKSGNLFLDKVSELALQIKPDKQQQVLDILKTFID